MAERKTSAGIVVETESGALDARALPEVKFWSRCNGYPFEEAAAPGAIDPQVAALVRLWAGHYANGWEQVSAIVQHLRSDYVCDRTARVPEDCRDPLGHFLRHSRRGPDYQFAGAAALLLRGPGYST